MLSENAVVIKFSRRGMCLCLFDLVHIFAMKIARNLANNWKINLESF